MDDSSTDTASSAVELDRYASNALHHLPVVHVVSPEHGHRHSALRCVYKRRNTVICALYING